MPKTKCSFHVTSPTVYRTVGPDYTGVCLPSADDVQEMSRSVGVDCIEYATATCMEVDLDENDPRYQKAIAFLSANFGWLPQQSMVIRPEQFSTVYGVQRIQTWTEIELAAFPHLRVLVNATIAKQSDGTSEQVDSEVFSYCDVSRTTKMGVVMPFHGIGVADDLVKILEKEKLKRLRFTPGVDNSGKSKRLLYALRSDVIMPPALNPLINEAGEVVPPNTEWWCFHDDGGRSPQVLRYREAEVKALGDFDIAMTHERVGYRESAAYRWCIVSQKFREVLKKLKVRAVTYVPVELES